MGILYPDEGDEQVHRHSSIDQFRGFLSTMVKGGWAPIVFDQLDGIDCSGVHTHPVIISLSDDIGYVFPEAHCSYTSDKIVYFDKEGVEHLPLPDCFGGGGEFYDRYISKNTFINFDNDTSAGTHNRIHLRTGLDYVLCDENLPPVA